MGWIKEALRASGITRLLWLRKARQVERGGARARDNLRYVLFDPELDNFTYELENVDELADWLDGIVAGAGPFVYELLEDGELRRALDARTRWRPGSKNRLEFGRRAGWYALIRGLRPDIVVETGTHDGLGSSVVLAALERNQSGRLISIDPRQRAGWLVPPGLRHRWEPLRATSFDALPTIEGIELFIHDSLHTRKCEEWELRTALAKGVRALVSDNAHALPTLREVAAERNLEYSFWREAPKNHWYPGAGIGLALVPALRPGTTEDEIATRFA